MIIKYDCTYFPGDRPCHFHKTEGVKCDTCTHYAVAEKRILITDPKEPVKVIWLDGTGYVRR